MQQTGSKLGIISLIFSIIGLAGTFIVVAIFDALNIPLSYSTGLIFMLVITSFGILGLYLGIVSYTGKNKDALGLVAFIFGTISIILNAMMGFCATLGGMA